MPEHSCDGEYQNCGFDPISDFNNLVKEEGGKKSHKHVCTCGGRCVRTGIIVYPQGSRRKYIWIINQFEAIEYAKDLMLKKDGFKFCFRKIFFADTDWQPNMYFSSIPEMEIVEKENEIISESNLDLIVIVGYQGHNVIFIKKLKGKIVSECLGPNILLRERLIEVGKEIMKDWGRLESEK